MNNYLQIYENFIQREQEVLIPVYFFLHTLLQQQEQTYTMNGHQLEETEEERDIGVIMSRQLKPSAQCRAAARSGQVVLG